MYGIRLQAEAQFLITPLAEVYADKENKYAEQYTGQVYTLMTTRSHDQYNTTLYGLDDRYRGVFGQRRGLVYECRRYRCGWFCCRSMGGYRKYLFGWC